jgi:hypothetical protein
LDIDIDVRARGEWRSGKESAHQNGDETKIAFVHVQTSEH